MFLIGATLEQKTPHARYIKVDVAISHVQWTIITSMQLCDFALLSGQASVNKR